MDGQPLSARTLQLSAAQAGLLVQSSGPRGELCPLPILPQGPRAAADLTVLQNAGLLDRAGTPVGEWRGVADTLAAPDLEILAVAGGMEGVTHLRAFGSPATAAQLVAYGSRGAGECTVAWPVVPDDLLALFTVALGLDANTPDPGVRLELTTEGFLVLAAALDALREVELEALLARDQEVAPLLTPAAIRLALRAGMVSDDSRWLVPIFRRLLPAFPEIDDALVNRGLEDLVGAAILARGEKEGDFALVPAFEPARLRLQAPLAWGTLAAVGLAERQQRHWIQLGALRTLGALWGVEAENGRVRFVTTDEPRLLAGLRTVLEAGRTAAKAVPPPVATRAAEWVATDAAAAAGPRFCSQCGHPLQPGGRFCGGCGAAVAVG